MTEKQLRKKAMALPLHPGVYIMKNKEKKIIYIGKAKKLKNRVSQYFGSHSNHSLKVIRMVENVDDFDYILCDSEFEALVLECSLIKQHQPKYNILLKDDKGYNYIKITKEQYPKIRECKQMADYNSQAHILLIFLLSRRLMKLCVFLNFRAVIKNFRKIIKKAARV